MAVIAKMLQVKPIEDSHLSALEILEQVSEVEVRKRFMRESQQVSAIFGNYSDIYVRVTGEGDSISSAAEECLAKSIKAGILVAPGCVEGQVISLPVDRFRPEE